MSPAPQPLPVETLLSDAGWVRRLAARLVADPGTADDVAQETLLAAWTRPPAHGTPARPWLARVLRNFVRQRARAEEARAARERASSRGAGAPDDLLERAELAQKLARLVLELEEPYRRTVLRRFFDGWSTEEIARAEGTNASTVRTRLERALAKLRERLERERGKEWLAALMPLVKMGGGLVMGTGAKIGIGLCTAALCGWLFWPRAEPAAPALEPPKDEVASVKTPLEGSAPVERQAQPVEPAAMRKPELPAAPAVLAAVEPGTIEGLVLRVHGENEMPIEGAEVRLWSKSDDVQQPFSAEAPPDATARSQSDGSFRFAGLEPGNYILLARSQNGPLHGTEALVPEKGHGARARIVFGSTRIHGRVHDEAGQPLAGLLLLIEGGHEFRFALHAEAVSNERGDYSFDELPAGKYFGSVTREFQGEWPGRMLFLTLVDGDDFELDFGLQAPPPHWRGSVRTGNGELVNSGGTLHLERVQHSRLGSEAKTYREVLFEGDASFDVLLEPGEWQPGVSLRSKTGKRRTFEALAIGPQGLEHDLVLTGTRLHGTVFDASTQQPLTGYAKILEVSLSRPGPKYPGAFVSVAVDDSGRFAIDMLEEGAWELTTHPLKVAAAGAKLELVIGPGETELRLDVQVTKP